MRPAQKTPHARGRGPSDVIAGLRSLYGSAEASRKGWQSPSLPRNWRERLPCPADYYSARVAKLGKANAEGWAQGRCPLHDDRHESLSVSLVRGGWRCFAGCGKGDLVSFHERLTGKAFKDAMCDLLEVRA